MQNTPDGKYARVRLAFFMAGSSLAIGSVVWLMVSFWPRSSAPLEAYDPFALGIFYTVSLKTSAKQVGGSSGWQRNAERSGRQSSPRL